MTKIEKIPLSKVDDVKSKIMEHLEPLGAELGLSFEIGGATCDPNQMYFHSKLTVSVGNKEDQEKRQFNKYCSLFGLEPSDYGRDFRSGGRNFKLIGFNLRASKMPIIARNEQGVEYKFTETAIKPFQKEKSNV